VELQIGLDSGHPLAENGHLLAFNVAGRWPENGRVTTLNRDFEK
jgi:hypothetical protein